MVVKSSLVCVPKSFVDNLPSFRPFLSFLVHEDTLKFDDGESRMSVVELDGGVVGELRPRFLKFSESTTDITQRCETPECLLFQS